MANVYNKPIVVIGGGGGGAEIPVDNGPIYEGKYRVRYFDVDGTILKIEYVANGGRTTPPDAPAYDPDYLIFDEWNYDTANYIVEQPTDIGATYKTVDDLTYIWCRFTTNTGLRPTLRIGTFTSIDWGDGTIDTNKTHTYAQEGDYVIKISGLTSLSTNSNYNIISSSLYSSAVKKVYFADTIRDSANSHVFRECNSLQYVSIPKSMKCYSQCFYRCYSLKYITLPKNTETSLPENPFESCYSLRNISLPSNYKTIGEKFLYECYSLDYFAITGLTSLSQYSLSNCRSINTVILPKTMNGIGQYAFNTMNALQNLIILNPTFSAGLPSNTIVVTSKSFIIWVNDNVIEELKVATNWSKFAAYMKPLSWYPNLTDPNA